MVAHSEEFDRLNLGVKRNQNITFFSLSLLHLDDFRDLGRKHFCQAGDVAENFIQAKHTLYH